MVVSRPRPLPLDALVDHLERLDAAAVVAMAEEAVGHGQAISEVIGSLLLPAWRQLDGRGADGQVDRATIGAAAAITRRALARAAVMAGNSVAPSDRPPVMVVSSSTSADLLGADVVGELVTAAGWPVEALNGCLDTDGIATHLRAHRPAALIVTFVEATDLPIAGQVVAGAHIEGIPVIAWGPAFGLDDLRSRQLGADAWAPSLDVITSTLALWDTSPPMLVAAPEPPTGYLCLEQDRAALLTAAAKISGSDGEANDWTQRTAQSVVAHLVAAVRVGDGRILTEHLEAERRGLARNQLLDVHLLGLVDALAGALPEATEPARSYVLACRDDLRQALVSGRPRPSVRESAAVTVSSRPARSPIPTSTIAPEVQPPALSPLADASPGGAAAATTGQVFADILLLAALSCQTPLALVSVPRAQGQWSTLSYGFEHREGLNDPMIFNFVAERSEPVEITDLSTFPRLSSCALALPPHSLRWIYAAPLRNPSGTVLGVVAVLDRWSREGSRRERRAMLAVSHQMIAHLSLLRKVPSVQAAPPSPSTWTPPGPAGSPTRGEGSNGLVGLRRPVALPEGQQLLRSHEVAVLFDVTERTVINWAAAGKLPSLRTIGGHLRFHSEDVLTLLAGRSSTQRPAAGL